MEDSKSVFDRDSVILHCTTDLRLDFLVREANDKEGWKTGSDPRIGDTVMVIYGERAYVVRFPITPASAPSEIVENTKNLFYQMYDFKHNIWKKL